MFKHMLHVESPVGCSIGTTMQVVPMVGQGAALSTCVSLPSPSHNSQPPPPAPPPLIPTPTTRMWHSPAALSAAPPHPPPPSGCCWSPAGTAAPAL
jgi:hypothetical protein